MGDLGRGLYVKEGIPEKFRDEVAPLADIITPNQFELEMLTGADTSKFDDAAAAIGALHRAGPGVVLVTSYYEGNSPTRMEGKEFVQPDYIEMLASSAGELYRVRTPALPLPAGMAGSGDLCTAVFLSRWLEGAGAKRALELTAASVYGIMETTHRAGKRELMMIQAQKELETPSYTFSAEKLNLR
jgi:pyridoxine kinase